MSDLKVGDLVRIKGLFGDGAKQIPYTGRTLRESSKILKEQTGTIREINQNFCLVELDNTKCLNKIATVLISDKKENCLVLTKYEIEKKLNGIDIMYEKALERLKP